MGPIDSVSFGRGVWAISSLLASCTALGDVDEFKDETIGGSGSAVGGHAADGGAAHDGSGGTSSAGGMPAQGGTSQGGGAGNAPGTESCANGVDDDENGLLDCGDPACAAAGYRCVAPAPSGWTGPAVFHESLSETSCSGLFDTPIVEGLRGLVAPPASCSTCTCTVAGGVCTSVTLDLAFVGEEDGCSNACGTTVSVSPGACVDVAMFASGCASDDDAVVALSSVSTSGWTGGCQPSTQTPVVSEPSWQWSSVLCGAAIGGGCEGGMVCAPPSPPSVDSRLCVGIEGDVACANPSSSRSLVYRGVVDGRSCSPCTCDASGCRGSLELFDGDHCNNGHIVGEIPVPYAGACVAFGDEDDARVRFVPNPVTATCTPAQSEPIGEASPASPYTVCCGP